MTLLPTYVEVDGILFPGSFKAENVNAAMNYTPVQDDLFLVTYPKCGTTWLHQIVYLTLKKGQPPENPKEYHHRVPFMEMMGQESFDNFIRPGAFKTHLTVDTIPFSKEAKYIYLSRNPKDNCISFFEHTRAVPGYNFKEGKFDDYFEIFMKGRVNYNDYFTHVRTWYDLSLKQPNVIFLNFEELKIDPKENIRKIVEFMGTQYKNMIQKDPKVLDDIVHYSSFEVMKETTNEMMRHMVPDGAPPRIAVDFVRKGATGTWRERMSSEQSQRVDLKVEEILGDTTLPELWRRLNCI